MNSVTPDSRNRSKRMANLQRLLKPRHVAFIGGKKIEMAIGLSVKHGFAGKLWVVNPKYDEIAGVKCYRTIADLPEAPDASFIGVNRELTIDVVRELNAIGAGGAVGYAAGYAEVGGEGVALQARLVDAVGDLALTGPNCYGLLNYLDGVYMFASGFGGQRQERGIAFVGQSGNISLNLTINERSVPFAYVITCGNQAVLEVADYVEALCEDPRVTAIGLYIEGLKDIPAFARACAKAYDRNIPIVALKSGRSELGAQLAMSHTSSLSGNDKLYDALFDRLGVIRVYAIDEMLETLKLVSAMRPWPGERLAVFTCSGGESLVTADVSQDQGIQLPSPSKAQFDSLRQQLPNFATIANPLDYNTSLWGHEDQLTRCFSTMLGETYDAGMLVLDFWEQDEEWITSASIAIRSLSAASRATGRPAMLTASLPESMPRRVRDRIIEAGIVPLQGLHQGLRAWALGTRRARLANDIAAAGGGASTLLAALPPIGEGRKVLSEAEGKAALAKHGLTVPPSNIVSAADAPKAAAALGFPVVAKIAAPVLAHKTEAGAVALDLKSEADVADAVARMSASVARYKPGLVAETFLIERMVTGTVAELIVGIKRDPQFGLALVIGAGGILVELVADAATLLLPTRRAAVEQAISSLKIMKILGGYRGKAKGDVTALVDAVMAIAAFADANRDTLVELDINPLMVLPEGQGVVAVDALVVLAEG
ncbi:MAG: acetate--CoA ligase family protein [Rhodospirillaceae bacterium]|nr:acetate--CoA ligase family protein [Rhodospirillaceae bacterium]